jgi:hypothetical protein
MCKTNVKMDIYYANLVQRNFQGGFFDCIKQRSFLKIFVIGSQLWVNWNLIES